MAFKWLWPWRPKAPLWQLQWTWLALQDLPCSSQYSIPPALWNLSDLWCVLRTASNLVMWLYSLGFLLLPTLTPTSPLADRQTLCHTWSLTFSANCSWSSFSGVFVRCPDSCPLVYLIFLSFPLCELGSIHFLPLFFCFWILLIFIKF